MGWLSVPPSGEKSLQPPLRARKPSDWRCSRGPSGGHLGLLFGGSNAAPKARPHTGTEEEPLYEPSYPANSARLFHRQDAGHQSTYGPGGVRRDGGRANVHSDVATQGGLRSPPQEILAHGRAARYLVPRRQ